jgi:Predicted membrane-associated Zn-dependent proteases 1
VGGLAIVLFFVSLLAIILIHELGHYLTARGFDFRVLEYFVGFGPKIWSFRKGEIEYGVKAIPAGGYVKIAGMNPLENDVPPGDENRAYTVKPIWQRALVILAGPGSHFLVAGLIFAALLFFVGDLTTTSVIGTVEPTLRGAPAPAAQAGLQPGDEIVQIGDLAHPTPAQIGDYQRAHLGETIPFRILRDGQQIQVTMTPVVDTIHGEDIPRIGITLKPVPLGPAASIVGGYAEVGRLSVVSVEQIGKVFGPQGVGRLFSLLFTGADRQPNDAASVVGIGQQVGSIGSQGEWAYFFYLFGYVTLFVGLINLIPLPPFDGGHLAVLLIEKVRGRAVDMRKMIPVSAVVLSFFVLFVIATVFLDVWKPIPIQP